MSDRIQEIHNKGFDMSTPRSIPVEGYSNTEYSRTKVGLKTLSDAIIDVGSFKKINPTMTKENIQRAIAQGNVNFMRDASEFYFSVSGIYARLCKHLANFYRYDWVVTPHRRNPKVKNEKIIDGFNQISYSLDEFGVKEFLGEAALKVFRRGCYYGYIIREGDTLQVQELLPKYCRSRYTVRGRPMVEMNMKFFDDTYPNAQ